MRANLDQTAFQFHDRLLAIFRVGGLDGEKAVKVERVLWATVNGFSLEEAPPTEQHDPDVTTNIVEYFETLPADRYPNLVSLAYEFANLDWDGSFELFINLFVEGVSRLVPSDLPGAPE